MLDAPSPGVSVGGIVTQGLSGFREGGSSSIPLPLSRSQVTATGRDAGVDYSGLTPASTAHCCQISLLGTDLGADVQTS